MKNRVANYVKFMHEKLKEKFDGKVKSPFQLEKEERKKFFDEVKKEWSSHKKSHVKQLDKLDLSAVKEYFKEYTPDLDIKDIDMSYDLDRFDLSLWAHGKGYMYSVGAAYPIDGGGEAYIEVYKDLGEGKKEKVIDKKTFSTLKEAVKEMKKFESGKMDQ